jgi:hypothetical protein
VRNIRVRYMIPAEGHGALTAAPLNGTYARVAAMNICGPQPRLDLPLDIERQLLAQEKVLGCEVVVR